MDRGVPTTSFPRSLRVPLAAAPAHREVTRLVTRPTRSARGM